MHRLTPQCHLLYQLIEILFQNEARCFSRACRSYNRSELDATQLAEVMVWLGFANVIDAFHVSRDGQPTQTSFVRRAALKFSSRTNRGAWPQAGAKYCRFCLVAWMTSLAVPAVAVAAPRALPN